MPKILYITYDGLTDPLGQSQVLPYIKGLSKNGYDFSILSCEKKDKFYSQKAQLSEELKLYNIKWYPLIYHKHPKILSTLWDIRQLYTKALKLNQKEKFNIVHCRSYIASLIGFKLKQQSGIKFIFDMRGFWADERIEGKIWNIHNFLFHSIYKYFKKKETKFLEHADYTISLTHKAKDIIHTWKNIKNQPVPIEVIPCCADLQLFSFENLNENLIKKFTKELEILKDDFIISYLGSIGTWYMLDEMLMFFKNLLVHSKNAKFLFITGENPQSIHNSAKKFSIPLSSIIVKSCHHKEVPSLLSLSNISILFIKPVFSKSASSPTKQGEILGMGIPIICNTNIGDTDSIITNSDAGIIVNGFTKDEFDKSINEINALRKTPKEKIRNLAKKYYSLEEGVNKYDFVYKTILNK